jgi:hypothetical protein
MTPHAPNAEARCDYRRLLLIGLYFVASFYGCCLALSRNSIVYYCAAMLFATFATAWCAVDARRQGKPLLPVLQMITFFTWPVAVPAYLIWSRKLRGLMYAAVNVVCLYAVTIVSFLLIRRMYFGISVFRP